LKSEKALIDFFGVMMESNLSPLLATILKVLWMMMMMMMTGTKRI
jgi:hypothetical protein